LCVFNVQYGRPHPETTEESIKQSEKLMQEYYDELAKKQLKTHDVEKDIREEPNLTESDIADK